MKQSVEWLVNNYMTHSYIISPLRMLIFTVRAVFVRSNKLGYKMHLLLNTKEITWRRRTVTSSLYKISTDVVDPDPEPDPHVFGPPGSGSISQRYGSGYGSGSYPFLLNVLSGLK
jgi:hypothetical protein